MRTCLLVSLALAACGQTSARSDLPAALAGRADNAEVTPFSGWSVEGVRLYRVAWSEPDDANAQIVGVDEDGHLIEGVALMQRAGMGTAALVATQVLGVLMNKAGTEPLVSTGDRSFASEQEWSLVTHPHNVENGDLVFFTFAGEMNPTLVEHRVHPRTFEVTTRSAVDVLLAAGQTVATGDARCMPTVRCGCWDGCAALEPVRRPANEQGTFRQAAEPPVYLAKREDCYEGVCFQVCRADSPSAHCEVGALSPVDETCTGACAPSEAPYHCETLSTGCRQVPHPSRAPAE